jgi:hypothetical protein
MKNSEAAVTFTAIVGVPYGNQSGAQECQGDGSDLGGCLEQGAMQRVPYVPAEEADPRWEFEPACTREDSDGEVITSAAPGRRYVEVAQQFDMRGYVYSICNDDWSPTMITPASLVMTSPISSFCLLDGALDWDEVDHVSTCDLVAEFSNPENGECPWPLAAGDTATTETDEGSNLIVHCPIPKLQMSIDCDGTEPPTGLGWYYCESKNNEDNETACNDGIDEDLDGLTDCYDDGCTACQTACGGSGIGGCDGNCLYAIGVTEEMQRAIAGSSVSVICPL